MFVKLYFIALPLYCLLDLFWVGFLAKSFYHNQIGFLFKQDVNWIAVVVFYLIFTFGLVVFVISPAFYKQSIYHALVYGALFGLVAYSTYDLVNLATIKNWGVFVTIIDMFWGITIGASVSMLAYYIASRVFNI